MTKVKRKQKQTLRGIPSAGAAQTTHMKHTLPTAWPLIAVNTAWPLMTPSYSATGLAAESSTPTLPPTSTKRKKMDTTTSPMKRSKKTNSRRDYFGLRRYLLAVIVLQLVLTPLLAVTVSRSVSYTHLTLPTS